MSDENTALSDNGTATADPRELARATALAVAEDPDQVGQVVDAIDLGDGVTDFRLDAHVRGYEGWQWSVTLYHDVELDRWTVNESSLIPTDDALMPPAWVPWKDRLEPTDLAPTDSIGTDPDDPRLEDGFRRTAPGAGEDAGVRDDEGDGTASGAVPDPDASADKTADEGAAGTAVGSAAGTDDEALRSGTTADADAAHGTVAVEGDADETDVCETDAGESEDERDAVEEFDLSRRHVLSPLGRAQTAKRWYEGPRGPKAMSTKTAAGNLCSTCGFLVPLTGELNRYFGVCANKWSPDDGRVVSLDHGCGEHSEIDPPEPSRLWVQSKPAFDDLHIDIIAQRPREERQDAEDVIDMIDASEEDDDSLDPTIVDSTAAIDETDRDDVTVDDGADGRSDADDDLDAQLASEQDIEENTEVDADGEDVARHTVAPEDGPELEAVVELAQASQSDEAGGDMSDDDASGDDMSDDDDADAGAPDGGDMSDGDASDDDDLPDDDESSDDDASDDDASDDDASDDDASDDDASDDDDESPDDDATDGAQDDAGPDDSDH